MEFKGSKGEWYIENLNNPNEGKYPAFEIDISTELESSMCTVWYSDLFAEEAKANAVLISKAPKMLEMLKSIDEAGYEFNRWGELEQLIKEIIICN